jgi:hypothetical protein
MLFVYFFFPNDLNILKMLRPNTIYIYCDAYKRIGNTVLFLKMHVKDFMQIKIRKFS